jgi:hypothetical protein
VDGTYKSCRVRTTEEETWERRKCAVLNFIYMAIRFIIYKNKNNI